MTRNAFHGIKIDLSSIFLRKSQGDKRLRPNLHKLTLKFRTVFLICNSAHSVMLKAEQKDRYWKKTMNHSINPRSNADERSQLEDEFARQHASDTDEQLLSYVGSIASKLGRKPTKEETIGYRYIKSRLGNWPATVAAPWP